MITTTLDEIKKHDPDIDDWKLFLTAFNKTAPDDEPIELETILDKMGLDAAIWCLRACEIGQEKLADLACRFARSVAHLAPQESRDALDVIERLVRGEAMDGEMDAAGRVVDAAWAAQRTATARDAAWAAMDAAVEQGAAARSTAAAYAAAWAADAATWAARTAAAWTGTGPAWMTARAVDAAWAAWKTAAAKRVQTKILKTWIKE